MTAPVVAGVRRLAVLDIETRVSEEAARLLPRDCRRAGIERVALQEIVAVAALTFEVDADGGVSGPSLFSGSAVEDGEAGLIERLSGWLDPVYAAGGELLTFNGAHDISVVRRRCGRHWLFDRCDWPDWLVAGALRHVDLMAVNQFGSARRPSLVDACAGFGFAAGLEPTGRSGSRVVDPVCKAEVDVLATAVLFVVGLAYEARSPLPLMRGLTGLARGLLPQTTRRPHLLPLLRNPNVNEASAFLERHAADLALMEQARCLIPQFDGAILSLEWKEAVWDRYVMGAPRPRTPSEQQYSDRRLRSRR